MIGLWFGGQSKLLNVHSFGLIFTMFSPLTVSQFESIYSLCCLLIFSQYFFLSCVIEINISNIKYIIVELFEENIIRGECLLRRSLMKAQVASPQFTPVYATLICTLLFLVYYLFFITRNFCPCMFQNALVLVFVWKNIVNFVSCSNLSYQRIPFYCLSTVFVHVSCVYFDIIQTTF